MSLQVPEPTDTALARLGAVTPARLLLGRAGTSLPTAAALALRADHAAARDAVAAELDLTGPALAPLVRDHGLFAVDSAAVDLATHLRRPDLGRRLSDAARQQVARECPAGADLQVVVGDGLSAAAVHAQLPVLLPLLLEDAAARGLTTGRPFAVRRARVGVLNEVGPLLGARVVVLLVGERPGLATAESLSAYLAHRPGPGHTDADRNLVSNIHARGVRPDEAVEQVLGLTAAMVAAGRSGVGLRAPARGITGPPPG